MTVEQRIKRCILIGKMEKDPETAKKLGLRKVTIDENLEKNEHVLGTVAKTDSLT